MAPFFSQLKQTTDTNKECTFTVSHLVWYLSVTFVWWTGESLLLFWKTIKVNIQCHPDLQCRMQNCAPVQRIFPPKLLSLMSIQPSSVNALTEVNPGRGNFPERGSCHFYLSLLFSFSTKGEFIWKKKETKPRDDKRLRHVDTFYLINNVWKNNFIPLRLIKKQIQNVKQLIVNHWKVRLTLTLDDIVWVKQTWCGFRLVFHMNRIFLRRISRITGEMVAGQTPREGFFHEAWYLTWENHSC